METSTIAGAELLISGGMVLDGEGGAGSLGTVVIDGDRIRDVLPDAVPFPRAARTIDATGCVVTPGFIDPHQHSDLSPLATPWMESFLRQGVTTAISGNCGGSGWPGSVAADMMVWVGLTGAEATVTWDSADDYFHVIQDAGPAINMATLLGHGSIRQAVMGMDAREPSGDELRAMQAEVERSMEAGALGLSTGLIYAPGLHARTQELVELSRALGGGLYVSHMRNEGVGIFDAIAEAEQIGREARVPVHISHLKLDAPSMWGKTPDVFSALDAAKERGVDVSTDQYPYTAWETDLGAFLPPWASTDQLGGILESDRARLRAAVLDGDGMWRSAIDGIGWDLVAIGHHVRHAYSGRTIAEIARDRGDTDPFDTFCALLLEDPTAGVVGHSMSEEDVAAIRANPSVMVGSDGIATSPDGPISHVAVHPRYYGTFPRVLGRQVREQGLIDLGSAIAAMTSIPADRFGVRHRGRLRAGGYADVVVFDPERIIDIATFEEPHRFSEGIEAVVVNGAVAWTETGGYEQRAGRVLRGT